MTMRADHMIRTRDLLPLSPQLEIVSVISTMLYFGYTAVMVFGFWLLTGTIGFYTTYCFICKIYGAVKQD